MNRYSIERDSDFELEGDWVRAIGTRVRSRLDLSEDIHDWQVYDCIDAVILEEPKLRTADLNRKLTIRETVFNSLRRLDVIQDFLDDPKVTEIMINGYEKIFIEKEGRMIRTDRKFFSKERYEDIVQQIAAQANRIVNRTVPIVDARLKDGSRVHVILEPVSLGGTTMTIRKFSDQKWDMKKLVELNTLDRSIVDFLKLMIRSGYNMIVSGGTGSGKTTLLNLMTEFIPPEERVVTIEDSAELNFKSVDNLVRLETRNANVEGEHRIELKDLIRASLRLRPDRVIVGEVRGEEAFYMINAAMNTGHDGSLSTCHANSCEDAIRRLETMVLMECAIPVAAIRRQIGSAIDLIIHLGRLRDRTRKVLEIAEVTGTVEDEVILNPLFVFEELGEEEGLICGRWRCCGQLKNRNKLKLAGTEAELVSMEKRWAYD